MAKGITNVLWSSEKFLEKFVTILKNWIFFTFLKTSSIYNFREIPYNRCLCDTCGQKDRRLDFHGAVNGFFSLLFKLTSNCKNKLLVHKTITILWYRKE
jgi:hypothetical protein